MSAIRDSNTSPELIVRRLLSSFGYRYRLHVRTLPGNPDIVFPGRKEVIFVHGCFWHRRTCRKGKSMPQTRKAFWKTKLELNHKRDKKQQKN